MFSGIVEKVGRIESIRRSGDGTGVLCLKAENFSDGLEIGESIAVNGVCLSLKAFDRSGRIYFDVLKETFERTNLKFLRKGDAVNLERALRVGDRIGGHFVSGHIDGTGEVIEFKKVGRDRVLRISCEKQMLAMLVWKGSVALDGVSLTIAELDEESFSVHLIPLTLEHTALRFLEIGDEVNIELDMIGKYVKRYLESGNLSKKKIDMDYLREAGF